MIYFKELEHLKKIKSSLIRLDFYLFKKQRSHDEKNCNHWWWNNWDDLSELSGH